MSSSRRAWVLQHTRDPGLHPRYATSVFGSRHAVQKLAPHDTPGTSAARALRYTLALSSRSVSDKAVTNVIGIPARVASAVATGIAPSATWPPSRGTMIRELVAGSITVDILGSRRRSISWSN